MSTDCTPYDCLVLFRRTSIDSICDECYGVYGFWYKRRCIYIGKAEKQPIKVRLMQHWSDCHNDDLKLWIQTKGKELKITYKILDNKDSIHSYERFYISKYQPITNKTK